MSKKQATAHAECLKMNIELADNGIIIRNPELEDDVTLAMDRGHNIGSYNYEPDHSEEYQTIGRKIYDWLFNTVIENHRDDLIITAFDIDIQAVAKGRDFAEPNPFPTGIPLTPIQPITPTFEDEYIEPEREPENKSISGYAKQMIEKALRLNNGNRHLTAQYLGISDRTLYRRMKQYGIE